MSRPRPKFCVGEEAIFKEQGCANLRVEIDGRIYLENSRARNDFGRLYTGWAYHCSGDEEGTYAEEYALRKLPPEERTQWEDCAWQPTKQGVEA